MCIQCGVAAVRQRADGDRAGQRESAAVVEAAQQRARPRARLRMRQVRRGALLATHRALLRTSRLFSGPSAWRSRRHSSCSEQNVAATMPKLALVAAVAASAGSLRTSA